MIKTLISIGTRPEVIKMAPVINAMRKRPHIFNPVILFTGQHQELLRQMASFFDIQPNHALSVMQENQDLSILTASLIQETSEFLRDEKPDIVLAQGDTTTVMTTALACFYQHISFAHVEAGMRTHDRYKPFPEEINRRLADSLADLHFAPTELERENLLHEGIAKEQVFVTGNTVVDALLETASRDLPCPITLDSSKTNLLVTVHRRESFGDQLNSIFQAFKKIVAKRNDVEIIYPVHPNPNVLCLAQEMLGNVPGIRLIKPLDYGEFVSLLKQATLVLTDSGGIQEEAPSLNVPVLVLRETTERPQLIESGAGLLLGVDPDSIAQKTLALLENTSLLNPMRRAPNPFGDGTAGRKVVAIIEQHYA